MKPKTKTIITACAILLLFLGGLLTYFSSINPTVRRSKYAEAHAIGHERGELAAVRGLLSAWLAMEPDPLDSAMPNGGTVHGTNLLTLILQSEDDEQLVHSLDVRNDLIDVWGNPIQIQFVKSNVPDYRWDVIIRSFGPNGKAEMDGGDDLVVMASF